MNTVVSYKNKILMTHAKAQLIVQQLLINNFGSKYMHHSSYLSLHVSNYTSLSLSHQSWALMQNSF